MNIISLEYSILQFLLIMQFNFILKHVLRFVWPQSRITTINELYRRMHITVYIHPSGRVARVGVYRCEIARVRVKYDSGRGVVRYPLRRLQTSRRRAPSDTGFTASTDCHKSVLEVAASRRIDVSIRKEEIR